MFSSNLRRLRKEKGLTQRQLADILFVDCSSITKYETGKATPDFQKQKKLAEIFNVSLDYLMGRTDNNVEPMKMPFSTIKIPVFGYIPAGIPMEAIEDVLDYIEIPEEWIIGGREFFGLKIKGDSMEPEYRNGDIIIFLRQDDCENNEDCAIAINGNDWTFKRVEKTLNGVFIKPLNPNYETMFFSNKECEEIPVQVKGVFWELRRSKRAM